MKQLLIYESPFVLNREQHKNTRLKPGSLGFGFARNLNSSPLTTSEFAVAARDYPVVFAGEGEDGMPAVLTGIARDSNLFVDADGQWANDTYVPAFFRRYPFVTAEKPQGGDDFNVCVDAPVLTEADDGIRLFDDEGGNMPLLDHAIRFLSEYQQDVARTRAFMKQVVESGLLEPKTLRVERAGSEPEVLTGFSVINEERLQKLGGKALAKLSETGALGLMYVHLMSLGNVRRLTARADALQAA